MKNALIMGYVLFVLGVAYFSYKMVEKVTAFVEEGGMVEVKEFVLQGFSSLSEGGSGE